ncbi:MAG TPA: polysaccharide deacetylase family protein [Conexibacter sp.]|jgi:peptidoglycan/xylan/chitin deacetylase (PgdA/CDA1 family)|nr:polysaccharide deacetylase family protein [Conexibacter sp.]
MSRRRSWPDGRAAAVSLTFDNLGEAAEIELGLRGADEPRGGHWSVTNALPMVLEELRAAGAGLPATFFVEGVNAEIYPDALTGIAAAGHEVAFHAFCHEDWSRLTPTEEAANLDRGLAAVRDLGLEVAGFRPPGGLIGATTAALLAERDVRHCSPAGSAPGMDGGVAVLPFAWPAVDVFHLLPQFAALRAHVSGSDAPGGPEAVRAALLAAVDQAVADGGHAVLVLHTWMAEGVRDALRDVLARCAAGAAAGELWVARCDAVAAWVAGHAVDFAAPPVLDRTSWVDPA